MPGTNAGTLARNDLSEGGKVAAKRVGVFVVNIANIHLTEEALTVDVFFHSKGAKIRNLSFLARDDRISYLCHCEALDAVAISPIGVTLRREVATSSDSSQ